MSFTPFKIFFLSLVIVSCSSTTKTDEDELQDYGSVLDQTILSKKSDSDLNISRPAVLKETYGPSPLLEEKPKLSIPSKNLPVIALSVAPSASFSQDTLLFLGALKAEKVKVNIIFASGINSITLAHYAFGKSINEIEWAIFQFQHHSKGKGPYSQKWNELLKKHLVSSFKGSLLESAKIQLILSRQSFKRGNKQENLFKRGDLHEIILNNLEVYSTKKMNDRSISYPRDIFNYKSIKKAGADIVIGLRPSSQLKGSAKFKDYFLFVDKKIEKEKSMLDFYIDSSLFESIKEKKEYYSEVAKKIKQLTLNGGE
ncbi:hypothetical protein HON22_01150 [Candidatus Peregrinibacteria bacterium]|jgi:hypothetical protein|nr:hypothetical protein [Candidatus Peregrinibacteria bacterium]